MIAFEHGQYSVPHTLCRRARLWAGRMAAPPYAQGVRHRVLAVLERDHRVSGTVQVLPERGGVGMLGQRVQPGAFLDQFSRGCAGSPGAHGC